ncbi:hypothetical protein [Rhizomonospora bruguierae]|uniref:hypothetical protein n=1 Tax=Rhizomonospora bruguierae TaxID=1581705 RepID=UPI001BCC8A59|nr:hypothetical protein [Micromonospora sp. NBRC 107566]
MSATTHPTGTTAATVPAVPATAPRGTTLFALAAVSSVLAGLIHYAVVPEHRTEWVGYAVFFTLLGAFQLIWSAAVWADPRRWLLMLGAAVNAAAIGLWVLSRTAGIPLGPRAGEPEAVGSIDVFCVLAEAVAIIAVVAALWAATRRPASSPVSTS